MSHLPPLRPRGSRAAPMTDAREAVKAIPDGGRVYVGGGASAPMVLLNALVAERHRWTHLELVLPGLQQRLPVFEHAGEPFHFVSLQASPAFKYLWGHPSLKVLPSRYSDHIRLCLPDGPMPCDAALVTVSPPEAGMVSLGLSVGSVVNPVRTAPLVFGEVSPQMPYTFGAGELPADHFDALVAGEASARDGRIKGEDDPTSETIAALAVELIPDGSTIQFGIGSIPNAVLARLGARRGLRVHSGLIAESCKRLFEAGAVEGVMIATESVNNPVMRTWMHRNPDVLMVGPSITHGAPMLAALDGFVAINSAVEVALDGSANSEMANGEIISGPGGAPDYAFGASIASGGRHITALKSAASGGTLSRIVPFIEPPRPTTLPGYVADVIITEHGRAEVRAMGGRERALALAALAHPAHRAALEEAAQSRL